MPSPNKWVADVEFILTECVRLMGLPWTELTKLPPAELIPQLPHASGRGHMLCGQAAWARIGALAEEAARRARLTNRVTRHTIRTPLCELLVQRFIREGRPLDLTQVDRFLAAAGRAAFGACIDRRHLVPCHLMLAKDPDEIRVGPVIFRNRAATRRLLLDAARGFSRAGTPGERKHDRRLLLGALRYYRKFNWVAEVQIDGCDPDTSREVAEKAVTSALDCIHILFGARWTDRMRVGGPAIGRDQRAQLALSPDGELSVSLSWRGAGQVNFGDGWSAQLEEADLQHFLRLIGVALEAAVDPDLQRPASRRFLDAAQWFGEATRDDSSSTRVVKFVTALERMVMTEEKDDITALVSERVAALCFDVGVPESRDEWRAKVRTAYSLRSKLVHGALSPGSKNVAGGVALAAELAERTLLRALEALGPEVLRTDRLSVKSLAQWFKRVCDWADRMEAVTAAALPAEGGRL